MTDYEKFIYMVYFHVDPTKNNKVIYIGIGKRDRPWAMSNSGGESSRNCWDNYMPNVSTYRLKEVHG